MRRHEDRTAQRGRETETSRRTTATRAFLPRLGDSLRLKVTLGLVFPLVLILGAFSSIEYERRREAMLANLSFLAAQTGRVIENGIQHEMLSRNMDGLQHMLNAIGEDETLRIVYLLDSSGRVAFAPNGESVGQALDNRDPTCQPCHRLPPAERPASVVVTLANGQRVFRSMNPIENQPACQECHSGDGRLIGLLLTDISMAALEPPLAADLRENLLWWSGTILITVLIANLIISRLVLHPLERVARALARFGRGHLDVRLPAERGDEIGQLATAFNEMGQRLQTKETQNRALSKSLRREAAQRRELLQRLITAQEAERQRVARDLHDGLGQDLAGLAVSLEAAERLIAKQPEQARAQIRQTRRLVAETTEQAYEMILALRPSDLDDLGLVPALRTHAKQTLERSGIQFVLEIHNLPERLPADIETALFRTFQEAISNVMRHANAKRVWIILAAHDERLDGEVADDGIGFDPHQVRADPNGRRGLGLLGMQERIAQCGGTLEIHSQPGAGTRIRIQIPLTKTEHGR